MTESSIALTLNVRVTRVVYDEERDYPVVGLYLFDYGTTINVPWPVPLVPKPREFYQLTILRPTND